MTARTRKKIVIVGGGSNAWTPTIVKDMLLTESLAGTAYVLYDVKREAAELVAAFLRKLEKGLCTGSSFLATDNLRTAFEGADYFIITISTGGLSAMAHDIALPEEYGIFHTVGDTCGPGGWARALRNFPVFESLARHINRYAPGAMVLNYTNPMTVLTGVLARLCTGPVVGLCHGLFENLEFLKAYYKLKDESELSVSYAGVNHFFWITGARARGRDLLSDLRGQVRRHGFTALLARSRKGPAEHGPYRELATELLNETGIMPHLGDRHTCEFFPCYITSRTALRKYRLVRTTIEERWGWFRQRDRALRSMITGDIPPEYERRSRETAADIIAAHAAGNPFIDVGNVPNIGQVANLPRGAIVETAVRVDANGFSPICFGDLPQPALGLVEPLVHVFETTMRACFEKDRALALAALRLDPACACLSAERVRELGTRLMVAHRAFTRGLFPKAAQ